MNMYVNIDKKTKNVDDMLKQYNRRVEYYSNFSYSLIEDKFIADYFQYYKKNGVSVETYLKMFNSTESKKQFIARAKKVLTETKQRYISEFEKNSDLKIFINFDEFSEKTIKNIYQFVAKMGQKNIKSIKLTISDNKKGYKKSDLQNLLHLSELVDKEIYVEDNQNYVPLKRVLSAYSKMDEFVDKVNKKNLSPFEKFLLVHDYVASRIYTPSDNLHQQECRSFVKAMTSDKIVCVGYAAMIKEFCNRLGIQCDVISGYSSDITDIDEDGYNHSGHVANIVHIVDKKYGIDGYYFCDACWDSKRNAMQTERDYFYAALPIQDLSKIKQAQFFANNELLNKIPKTSKQISLNTFKCALNNVYSDALKVESDLQRAINRAQNSCEKTADNCFTQYLKQCEENTL